MKRTCALALMAVLVGAAHADQLFKITFTNTGPQPLSPLFYAASTSAFDEFSNGSAASAGIVQISEYGNPTDELGIAAASSAVGTYGKVGSAPLFPGGNPSNTAYFSADAAHPYFSFASMLGLTNDGFIGDSVSSNPQLLFVGGVAQNLNIYVFGADAWDAGATADTQDTDNLANLGGTPSTMPGLGYVHQHAGLIPGVGTAWPVLMNYAWTPTSEMAHISVQAVPEPMTMAGLGFGLLTLVRRRRKAN